MGLDVSHGAWSGGYGAFNRFRRALIEAMGGTWPDSFSGHWTYDDGRMSPATHPGIFALLNHSDCDGEIPADLCAALACELRDAAARMPASGAGHLSEGGARGAALRFADGCDRAHAAGEPLVFC